MEEVVPAVDIVVVEGVDMVVEVVGIVVVVDIVVEVVVGSAVEIVEEIVIEVVDIVIEVVVDLAVEEKGFVEEVTVTEPALVTETKLDQGEIVVESVKMDTDKVDGHVAEDVVDKADDVDTNNEIVVVINVVFTT